MTLMQKEIFSEPVVIQNTIDTNIEQVKNIASEIKKRNIKTFFTMARGTSDNAATCFSFACQTHTQIKVGKFHPSIFTIYNAKLDMSDTCLLVISQSGMSKDTINVLRKAKNNGAFIVGVTNNPNSLVAKESNMHLFLNVNEEQSVAATKTYISELVVLYMLVEALSEKDFISDIKKIPQRINDILNKDKQIQEIAGKIAKLDNFIILSRGFMQGTCDEMGLKLTECSYLFTKTFSTANFMHGPLSLLTENTNVILLAPSGISESEYISIAEKAHGANANLIAFSDIDSILNIANTALCMPKYDDLTNVVIYGVVASLLALHTGTTKGIDVDKPRNLNKVTITL